HSRRPPAAVAGRRQPGAHVRLRLRDVDPRHPLVAQLIVLVLNQLRGNLPRPRMTHPGLHVPGTSNTGGLPGDPVIWLSAANTDRRARQATRSDPQVKAPRQAFIRALIPRAVGVTGSPRPSSQPAGPGTSGQLRSRRPAAP